MNSEPSSIHKYAYAHADPANGIDPSGNFTLTEVISALSIVSKIYTGVQIAFPTANTYSKINALSAAGQVVLDMSRTDTPIEIQLAIRTQMYFLATRVISELGMLGIDTAKNLIYGKAASLGLRAVAVGAKAGVSAAATAIRW